MQLTLDEVFNRGVAAHQAGKTDEADRYYTAVLKAQPKHPDANHNMGILAVGIGKLEQALPFFKTAIEANSGVEQYWVSYIKALIDLRRTKDVQRVTKKAIKKGVKREVLKKLSQEVHHQRTSTLKTQDPSQEQLRSVIEFFNRGESQQALPQIRSLLETFPSSTILFNLQGGAFTALNQLDAAIVSFRQAIRNQSDFAPAHYNMGNALTQKGDLNGAIKSFRQAIRANPNYVSAHNNLGNALKATGDEAGAINSYTDAVLIEPDYAEGHNNLGLLLQMHGKFEQSLKSYNRALSLKPGYAMAFSNMLFCIINNPEENRSTIFDAHREFAERFEQPLVQFWPKHGNRSDSERRLKVGFVSADFREHALAHFFEPTIKILGELPNYTFYAYHNLPHEDGITQVIKKHFAHWRPVANLTDEQLSAKILEDEIDILIDLSGHSAGNRLLAFARKPAPVQVSWMGYPGTTGLQSMDYFMGPSFSLPPGECDDQFSEKIVGLPFTASYLPNIEYPAVNTLPALTNGYITFGSFFRPSKINRGVVSVWSELLRAIPSARLVMGGMLGDLEDNNFVKWFAEEGIDLGRITFLARTDMSHYFPMHHRVDVCLAPFPYVGGTTISTALMMGVPTLVMNGGTLTSSGGAGRMHYVGHGEYIAANEAEFIAKGVELSGDVEQLSRTRMALRDKTFHSYNDTELMRSSMDKALRTMWGRWCEGLEPIALEVEV